MLITELLAGLSAKAALGLGIAATSLTGAGVAVVLPAAAEHATDHPDEGRTCAGHDGSAGCATHDRRHDRRVRTGAARDG